MPTYRCHACACARGDFSSLPMSLTGSQYQVEKLAKHTTFPSSGSRALISIFDACDYQTYENYVINTHASGSAEYRTDGSLNAIVWAAGRCTGFTIKDGVVEAPPDAVKLVLPADHLKLHGYPTGSAVFGAATCVDCGEPVVT